MLSTSSHSTSVRPTSVDSFSLTIAGMLLYVLLAWALLQFIGSQRKDRVSLHLDKRVAQTELAFASARTHYQDVSKVMMGELAATEAGINILAGEDRELQIFLQPYYERWQDQVDILRVYSADGELRVRFSGNAKGKRFFIRPLFGMGCRIDT